MIVDNKHTAMVTQVPSENPPSYDHVMEGGSSDIPQSHPKPIQNPDTKPPLIELEPVQLHNATVEPLHARHQMPIVHHYTNPTTGQHVASLLPPDHPEMMCLQTGAHVPETKFGILGILAAVFWFPLGIGLCLLDRRVKCTRCGVALSDGICN